MSFFARLFNAADASIELHDVAGVGLLAAHIGLASRVAWSCGTIDLMGFGTGAAAIIGAVSAAGWMKGKQRAVDPACNQGGG